ncbi:MAG: hypothetical protein AAB922_05395, partial [Patescibacteria group bacterium]
SLDFYIVCNNNVILNGIQTKLPAKLDGKVWADGYDFACGFDMSGNKFVSGSIRFNVEVDRQTILNQIKDSITPTIASQILTGSWLSWHSCNHDEASVIACTQTKIWSK